MTKNTTNELKKIGIVYGKTTPYSIDGISLTDTTGIRTGLLVRLRVSDPTNENSDDKLDILGRISSVWASNRLFTDIDYLPRYKSKDIGDGKTNIGFAQEIAKSLGFKISIIGYQDQYSSFVRPRFPILPGDVIYEADDDFVAQFMVDKNYIDIGYLRDNQKVTANIDFEKLLSLHFAVLAMTGAGKSYTVGVILEQLSIIEELSYPILLIDPHSEYSATKVPTNKLDQKQKNLSDRIFTYIPGKENLTRENKFKSKYKVDRNPSYIKFHPCDLDTFQIKTLLSQYYGVSEAQSRVLDNVWDKIHQKHVDGNEPITTKNQLITKLNEIVENESELRTSKSTLGALFSKLKALLNRDFFDFSDRSGFNPTDMIAKGKISIIDLSGINNFDQQVIVGLIMRKLFDARTSDKALRIPPFLTIIEEAHNFIPTRTNSSSKSIISKIASEGRKFLMGLCIVSQRPSKIDSDILSQCNTFFFGRLMNPKDQKFVTDISEFLTSDDLEEIKGLETGTTMVVGQAVRFSLLIKIRRRIMEHGGITPSIMEELSEHN